MAGAFLPFAQCLLLCAMIGTGGRRWAATFMLDPLRAAESSDTRWVGFRGGYPNCNTMIKGGWVFVADFSM